MINSISPYHFPTSLKYDLTKQGVVDGMQELSWGRSLAIKTIKSIIASGQCNAARKRNKELAAAETPAPRGCPGRPINGTGTGNASGHA